MQLAEGLREKILAVDSMPQPNAFGAYLPLSPTADVIPAIASEPQPRPSATHTVLVATSVEAGYIELVLVYSMMKLSPKFRSAKP